MIDQALATLDDFRGVFANNDEDVVPPNHFKDALNIAYGPGIFFSRPGVISHLEIGDVRRIRVYQIPGEDDRLLILNGSGQLFDSTNLATPILAITTPVMMSDFTSVSIFGRAYISPHNGTHGLDGEVIYVYDGADLTFIARPGAGNPPAGFELVLTIVVPTAAGNDIVAPTPPVNGFQTLTSTPYIPNLFNSINFTQTGGTVTNITITVIGIDSGHEPLTMVYVDKIASGVTPTYTTGELWQQIDSIEISNLTGSGGNFKVELSGVPIGKFEIGYHIIGVVYETVSGFLTKPGPENNLKAINVKQKKRAVKVDGIPASPGAEVAKIHIVASKFIKKKLYSGNPDPNQYEMFFVPKGSGGEIYPGTTSTVINVFDADLLDSADYLLDNFSQIPAGVTLLATSKGRLLIGGEFENNAILRASTGGEPEVFSETDGFVICDPVTGGIRNLAEYRDCIYVYKSHATLITQDNEDLPSTWRPNQIDRAIGSECHGIGTVLGREADTADAIIVADRSGLHAFNGAYPAHPLSWKIKEIWDTISDPHFYRTEVAVDPVNKLIMIVFESINAEGSSAIQRVINPGFETEDFTGWTISDVLQITVIANPGGGLEDFICLMEDTGGLELQIDQIFTIADNETATISVIGSVSNGVEIEAVQRVINPGAEDGVVDPWIVNNEFLVFVVANPGGGTGSSVFQFLETGENSGRFEQSFTIEDNETATIEVDALGTINDALINFFAFAPTLNLWLQADGTWDTPELPWTTHTGNAWAHYSLVTTVPTGELTITVSAETDGDIENNGDIFVDEYTWTSGEVATPGTLHFKAYAPTLDLWLDSTGNWVSDVLELTDWATQTEDDFITHTLVTTVPTGETTINIYAISEIDAPGGEFFVDEYTWTTEVDIAVDSCIVGDYSEGLDWQNIKWGAYWEFYNQEEVAFSPETIVTHFDPTVGKVVFRLGHRNAEAIYSYEHGIPSVLQILDDDGSTIAKFFEIYKYKAIEDGSITQITGMRIKITGFGEGTLTLFGSNGLPVEQFANLTIPSSSGGNILEKLNFVSDDISIRFDLNDFRTYFQVSKIWLFGSQLWGEKPSGLEFDLKLDLISYYDLEEASGLRIDAHGINDLTDNNTVTNIVGKVGNAAQFVNANSEWLSATITPELGINGHDFTITAWIKFDSFLGLGFNDVIASAAEINQGSSEDWQLYHSDNFSGLGFYYRDATGAFQAVAVTIPVIVIGTFYFIAVTFDPDTLTLKMQVNDYAPITTICTLLPRTPIALELLIGRGPSVFLNGIVDELGIWNRILSAHEIEFLYNQGAGKNYEGLDG